MFSLLGHSLLALACVAAVGLGVAAVRGAELRRLGTLASAHALLLILAMLTLIAAFVVSDFSLETVFANSHTAKPLFFRIAGAWGNHEGSMLMWAVMSAGYVWLFAGLARGRISDKLARATLGFSAVAMLGVNLFVATVSSPFATLDGVVPTQGRDLNPLLQDIGLVIHPPVLYLGYTALLIPWALACASLATRAEPREWGRAVQPWSSLALAFLTCGIMLGSWWAYRELGWGGWWFWDPVENVSVIPWLLGIGLAHSALSVMRGRGLLGWSLALGVLAYGSTLLGTFLVRSGTLVSVHAFAADPGRGIAILSYLTLLIGGGLVLIAARMPSVETPPAAFASRDTAMRVQNVLIAAVTITILLGTVYPPVLTALGQPPLAVGEPYYVVSVIPVAVLILLLMGIATSLPWRRGGVIRAHSLFLRVSGAVGAAAGLALGVATGHLLAALTLATGVALLAVSFRPEAAKSRAARRSALATRLAHGGVGLFAVAAAFNTAFDLETDREIAVGESFTAGGHRIEMLDVREAEGANWYGAEADLRVDGRHSLSPQYRFYPVRAIPTTEADIHTNLWRDLRATLNLVETRDDRPIWAVRFHRKPGMLWLWIATLVIAAGLMVSAVNGFRMDEI